MKSTIAKEVMNLHKIHKKYSEDISNIVGDLASKNSFLEMDLEFLSNQFKKITNNKRKIENNYIIIFDDNEKEELFKIDIMNGDVEILCQQINHFMNKTYPNAEFAKELLKED